MENMFDENLVQGSGETPGGNSCRRECSPDGREVQESLTSASEKTRNSEVPESGHLGMEFLTSRRRSRWYLTSRMASASKAAHRERDFSPAEEYRPRPRRRRYERDWNEYERISAPDVDPYLARSYRDDRPSLPAKEEKGRPEHSFDYDAGYRDGYLAGCQVTRLGLAAKEYSKHRFGQEANSENQAGERPPHPRRSSGYPRWKGKHAGSVTASAPKTGEDRHPGGVLGMTSSFAPQSSSESAMKILRANAEPRHEEKLGEKQPSNGVERGSENKAHALGDLERLLNQADSGV